LPARFSPPIDYLLRIARALDPPPQITSVNSNAPRGTFLPGLQKKKGTPILFAIFEQQYAFLLDISPHDDWSTDRLAKISYCNWGQRHVIKVKIDALLDGEGNPINLKDQERVFVRNTAINVPIEIDTGLYVFPRTGGVMANGYSAFIVKRCEKIWNSLAFFVVRRNRPGFKDYFENVSRKPLHENSEFRFRFLDTVKDWEYAIIEEKTLFAFLLPDYFGIAGTTGAPQILY
jgi:hypothetical protein